MITHILKRERIIITASERAGKTALARSLFKDLRRNGRIPLLLTGREIKPATVRQIGKHLDRAFGSQYSAGLKSRYWQLGNDARAVIVDDYHLLPMTKDLRDALMRELLRRFSVVILLGGNELRVQELMGHDRESRLLWTFNHCEVMGFGHRLRAEFIRKWYRIGRIGQVEDEVLVRRAIELEKTISNILGHDLLPSYPIYILLLLQQLESNNPLDTTAASYGRLYGAVLTAYLAKSGTGDDLETKINYLTEFAYYLYSERKDHVSDEEGRQWHAIYCKRHLDLLNYDRLREELVRAQALQFRNGELRFRYKASFYYFVAAYFADNLARDEVREEVKELCTTLHRENASNIVLFLCHKSKDPTIVNAVLATADGLFHDRDEINLIADTAFAGRLQSQLETPVLVDGDPEKRRLRALEVQDKLRPTSDDDEEAYTHRFDDESDDEAEEDEDARRLVAEFNSAIKTIQITGQILRNFGGRLDGTDKIRLTEASYSLGLRLMSFIYTMFGDHESVLVDSITSAIVEKKPSLEMSSARQVANAFLFALLKVSTIGLIKHVSNSVGLEKLAPVFAEVLKTKPTIARKIVDLSIRLDHFGAFPVDQTLGLNQEVQGSLIALDVLRQLVFNRFYFFSAPHDVKQRICSKLEIKIQPILLDTDQKRDR